MIECNGIWLPDGEQHLVDMIGPSRKVGGRGTYQYQKLVASLRYVKTRARAVDVGAHVGTWAMHLCKAFAYVDCFEPVPEYHECFRANIPDLHGQGIELHECALGAKTDTVVMERTIGSSGHTFVRPSASAPRDYDDRSLLEAEMLTLDSFNLRNVGLIKIDVEGYEYFVLDGARETILREHPVLVVEQKAALSKEKASVHGKTPWRGEMASRYGLGDTEAIEKLTSWGMVQLDVLSGDFVMGWV